MYVYIYIDEHRLIDAFIDIVRSNIIFYQKYTINIHRLCGLPFKKRLIPHSVFTLQGRMSGIAVSINFGMASGS